MFQILISIDVQIGRGVMETARATRRAQRVQSVGLTDKVMTVILTPTFLRFLGPQVSHWLKILLHSTHLL